MVKEILEVIHWVVTLASESMANLFQLSVGVGSFWGYLPLAIIFSRLFFVLGYF